MYAFVSGGIITDSSLSLNAWRRHHPQISLPVFPTEEQLNEQGIYTVELTPRPSYDYTKNVESSVSFNGTKCIQEWAIFDATAEEIATRTQEKAEAVREERTKRLSESDWTQIPDAPVNASAWSAYRQALRDVPEQAGFPWEVAWPEQP